MGQKGLESPYYLIGGGKDGAERAGFPLLFNRWVSPIHTFSVYNLTRVSTQHCTCHRSILQHLETLLTLRTNLKICIKFQLFFYDYCVHNTICTTLTS